MVGQLRKAKSQISSCNQIFLGGPEITDILQRVMFLEQKAHIQDMGLQKKGRATTMPLHSVWMWGFLFWD
jgi:hypothetical protein